VPQKEPDGRRRAVELVDPQPLHRLPVPAGVCSTNENYQLGIDSMETMQPVPY
jgi:hypothetical protein